MSGSVVGEANDNKWGMGNDLKMTEEGGQKEKYRNSYCMPKPDTAKLPSVINRTPSRSKLNNEVAYTVLSSDMMPTSGGTFGSQTFN